MLVHFSFKNFKSYKYETELDFQAAALPEFSESLLKISKATDVLPVGVIYGPNGGGKTNLLQALACLVNLVVKPIVDLDKNRVPLVIQQAVGCSPFMLDRWSADEPTEFQVFFRTSQNEYRYYIALLKGEVHSESLYWRAIGGKRTGTVFEREGSEIVLGPSIRKNKTNTQVNPRMPYLSFLAINYDIPAITEVQRWFESCIVQNYSLPEVNDKLFGVTDESTKKTILRALNDLDIDIDDYHYDIEEKKLFTSRRVGNDTFEMPFAVESEGTKKLISLLPGILLALREGRFVVIDELDAKLHPKLLRYIIRLFKNPEINREKAQLLFTSHDLTTMRNTVFRRDEIWFAEANDNHESRIYSLYDIRDEHDHHINNTAAYDKQYLEGRYGADPYLQNMLGGEWG